MIVRTWTGWTSDDRADEYADYMREVALAGYAETPGNQGVMMLRRPTSGARTEFVMVTLWDSMEAVHAFTGDDPDKAVFYDRDDEFLVDRRWEALHYEVYGQTPMFGAGSPPR